ncbi:MAG: hypothetical protein WAN14_16160 [Candidatus Acidiferrales bacterium]
MRSVGSFATVTIARGAEFYLNSPFRSRQVQLSLGALLLLCAFAIRIVVKAWVHLSVFSIAWIAFGLFWAFLLFRVVLRTHGSLKMLLATRQIDPMDKESLLGDILGVVAEFSNTVLFLSFWSILALLMAVALILSGK